MATEGSVMAVIRASRPSFRNPHDNVAFYVHAAFLAAGYALTATGKAALSDPPPAGDEEVGIDGWHDFEDSYGFVYAKATEKGEKRRVLVKCLAVGDVLAVDALSLDKEQKEPFNLQINVKDYVPEGNTSTGNYGGLYQNLKDLVNSLNKGILNALESSPKVGSSSSAVRREVIEPSSCQPAVGVPVEPQSYSPLVYPPVPYSDFNDVYPGPGAGFFPQRGGFGDGSMLVGPNDPRFGRIDRPDLGYPSGLAGIPPGARFDPIGPPDVPGFEPGRFIRPPRRPGGGTHPDLEHFQGPDYF
uniref:Putative proteasome inhibitor n=1 Tax=Anthurium amnicola TaxID=1678845 RepID=A0A1D1YJE4_9ARAE